jgi:hypothetical protein
VSALSIDGSENVAYVEVIVYLAVFAVEGTKDIVDQILRFDFLSLNEQRFFQAEEGETTFSSPKRLANQLRPPRRWRLLLLSLCLRSLSTSAGSDTSMLTYGVAMADAAKVASTKQ